MESLAKVTMTEHHYKAVAAILARGDVLHKRFKEFKQNEAIIVKKLWGFIPYKSYNRKGLFREFETDITFTFPVWGGEGKNKWKLFDNSYLTQCNLLSKFSPHEECYLTADACDALKRAVIQYEEGDQQ